MSESVIGLFVAAVTIFLTNIFSYLFAIKKEVRVQSTQYKIEILDKVYTPIFKILSMDVIPGDGYECIDDHQLESINRIVNENVNLVDPKLNSIIWSLKEEARYAWENKREENDFIYLDENRVLLNHVIDYHNKLRKSVGLPYESLLSNRISNLKTSYKRIRKKIRRILKRWFKF